MSEAPRATGLPTALPRQWNLRMDGDVVPAAECRRPSNAYFFTVSGRRASGQCSRARPVSGLLGAITALKTIPQILDAERWDARSGASSVSALV